MASRGENEYWLPGYGLSRHVVFRQLQYFIGPSATVRPFTYHGREGYLIKGAPLTKKQIEDLRKQSEEYEKQQSIRMQGHRVGADQDRRIVLIDDHSCALDRMDGAGMTMKTPKFATLNKIYRVQQDYSVREVVAVSPGHSGQTGSLKGRRASMSHGNPINEHGAVPDVTMTADKSCAGVLALPSLTTALNFPSFCQSRHEATDGVIVLNSWIVVPNVEAFVSRFSYTVLSPSTSR